MGSQEGPGAVLPPHRPVSPSSRPVIGGIASSSYAYGPGYGYDGYPGYYGGYAPAYYGGYGYDPYPWGSYTTTYYSTGYAPAYAGYRRVVWHRW